MPDTGTITDRGDALQALKEKTKDVRFTMMTTIASTGQAHSRPMATHEIDDDGVLWFFTYTDSQKVRDVATNPQIALGYADPGENLWVSVTGRAELVRDDARKQQLWSAPLKTYFPNGPEDPDVALLRVEPEAAEIWDGPSSAVGRGLALARTYVSGSQTPPGDDVELDLSGR